MPFRTLHKLLVLVFIFIPLYVTDITDCSSNPISYGLGMKSFIRAKHCEQEINNHPNFFANFVLKEKSMKK